MRSSDATGLRNLFKLSSLASFEGQLGKWSRMDAELIAEHAEGIIATTGYPDKPARAGIAIADIALLQAG